MGLKHHNVPGTRVAILTRKEEVSIDEMKKRMEKMFAIKIKSVPEMI